MSAKAVGWALEQSIKSPGAKLILVLLADHANSRTGLCIPGHERLAARASMSTKSVSRHLKELEQAGFISRHQRRRSDGSRTSDGYTLYINRTICQIDEPHQTICPDQPDKLGQVHQTICRGINLEEEPEGNLEDIPPPEGDGDDVIIQSKATKITRTALRKLRQRYENLTQAQLVDEITGLFEAWGRAPGGPTSEADAWRRLHARLKKRDAEAFEQVQAKAGPQLMQDRIDVATSAWHLIGFKDDPEAWHRYSQGDGDLCDLRDKDIFARYIWPGMKYSKFKRRFRYIVDTNEAVTERGVTAKVTFEDYDDAAHDLAWTRLKKFFSIPKSYRLEKFWLEKAEA